MVYFHKTRYQGVCITYITCFEESVDSNPGTLTTAAHHPEHDSVDPYIKRDITYNTLCTQSPLPLSSSINSQAILSKKQLLENFKMPSTLSINLTFSVFQLTYVNRMCLDEYVGVCEKKVQC